LAQRFAIKKEPKRKSKHKFLEPSALQDLRNLRFAAKRIVEGTTSGRHRSNLRGSSVEFADYRAYTPGDDLRRLDWKVYLRIKKPFVRTYDEETNMTVSVLLDVSASMDFGGAQSQGERGAKLTKLDYSRFLAAALAYLVVDSRDQAALALIGDGLRNWCEPGATRVHLDKVLTTIEKAEISQKTNLGAAMRNMFTLCKRRGLLVIVSDFLDPNIDDFFQCLRLFRHRRFEVILFHVIHPEEITLPEGRAFRFYDPEDGGEIEVDPQDVAEQYRAKFEEHRQRIRNLAIGCGCEYEMVDTTTPYPEAIRAYLRRREAFGR
jgi:uncharacterized protein (DUF58 family)